MTLRLLLISYRFAFTTRNISQIKVFYFSSQSLSIIYTEAAGYWVVTSHFVFLAKWGETPPRHGHRGPRRQHRQADQHQQRVQPSALLQGLWPGDGLQNKVKELWCWSILRKYFPFRNILCFPISDNDEVIGVAELCNKQSGSHFTKFDEEMAMAFRFP